MRLLHLYLQVFFKFEFIQYPQARTATSYRLEDEHNVLRALTFDDYAPLTPLYSYHLLNDTESVLEKCTTSTVCIETFKQIIMAYSCLYNGFSTFIINLINHSDSINSYNESWLAQYGDGTSNDIHTSPINPCFVGSFFPEISWVSLLYSVFIHFLVSIQVPSSNTVWSDKKFKI